MEKELGGKGFEEIIYQKLNLFIESLGDYQMEGLYHMVMEMVERPLIQAVLKKTKGNQSQAAKLLGINRNTLAKKIKKLKVKG